MLIELDKLESQQAHDLPAGVIVPRPIAWVSTVNRSGQHNLAPFSFSTGVTWLPATVAVSIVNRRDGSDKDTLRNVRENHEFAGNLVLGAEKKSSFPPLVTGSVECGDRRGVS